MTRFLSPIKVLLFIALMIPLGIIVFDGFQNNLTADPIEELLHRTGIWSLRLLLLTMLMTPMKVITGSFVFIRVRRMIGLFAFFYASLHLLIYVWLDLGLDWAHLLEDIIERTFITVGMLAWLLMLPMAITSNKRMMRKLGKTWKRIHQAIYLVICLASLHFIWLVKSDITEPLIYTGIGLSLLLFRVAHHYHGKRSKHKGSTNTG
ncbi:sulfite oxidase heme-binding subunit YedZ [Marinicella litoralis]|uniref:Protein-methionine-sulfoxide reductase heme-binding subunit MsrQ n=1 Tax=Marinicella litoralis TaxID=644220 RepID=A0A4R6XI62_9GAMM|nr:protein-methionine-sulfoxide reductase heme-binding subunit MsrQ [Marinicella litoralis]TDR17524.1 sulfoxide reductase heme-binding subunit YedZ [Marinicella litoralis]